MKKCALKLGLFSVILLGMISCKNEKNDLAEQKVKALETYIDSLKTVDAADREANWDKIAADYDRRNAEANEAVANLNEEERARAQAQVDAASVRYVEYKTVVLANQSAKETKATPNPNQKVRNRFFGEGKVGEDMDFSWVNKDNILQVYKDFYESYKANKDDFTREDFDEVKLLYEALDSRKNTVEKEGLSSEDNNKIASLKFKLAPMFKINRIGAKTREMNEAKE
jgi:vacuolar-type H+-ATPase subunit I/STV1